MADEKVTDAGVEDPAEAGAGQAAAASGSSEGSNAPDETVGVEDLGKRLSTATSAARIF